MENLAKPEIITLIFLILGTSIFIAGAETAGNLERNQHADYANLSYVTMVFTSIMGLAIAVYCTLSLHHTAEQKARNHVADA